MKLDQDQLDQFADLYEEWLDIPTACNGEYVRAAKRILPYGAEFLSMTFEPFQLAYRMKGQLYVVRMGSETAIVQIIDKVPA